MRPGSTHASRRAHLLSCALCLCALVAILMRVVSAAPGVSLNDAVKSGDRTAVRRLIAQHVNINTAEPDGTTALHWAVRANDRETVGLLLKAGAKPTTANRYGVTPIRL